MTPSSAHDERLFDLIYEAATDRDAWSKVLVEIADRTGSIGGMLIGVDVKAEIVPLTFNGRMREESHATYQERHISNPWADHMVRVPIGKIVQSDEILPLGELRQTTFFDEVLRPQDMAHNVMLTLARRKDFFAAFNICRSERQGVLDAKGLDLITQLYPHLRRSLLLGFRLGAYGNLQRAQYDVLDRLSMGLVLLDRQERIIYANAAATTYDADASALLLRNSIVTTPLLSHNRRLGEMIQAALRGTPASCMGLPQADGRLLTLLVQSVRGQDVGRFGDLGMLDAAVLIFIIDPANRAGIPIAWIMDAYRLTQAEARVAIAISAGSTIPETAARLGLSPNTVKTHLRHVFAKTGTSRQAELASLMTSIGLLKSK